MTHSTLVNETVLQRLMDLLTELLASRSAAFVIVETVGMQCEQRQHVLQLQHIMLPSLFAVSQMTCLPLLCMAEDHKCSQCTRYSNARAISSPRAASCLAPCYYATRPDAVVQLCNHTHQMLSLRRDEMLQCARRYCGRTTSLVSSAIPDSVSANFLTRFTTTTVASLVKLEALVVCEDCLTPADLH